MSLFTPSHKHKSGKSGGDRGKSNKRWSRDFLIKCITATVRCSPQQVKAFSAVSAMSVTEHQPSPRLHTVLLSPLVVFTLRIPQLCVYLAQINCSVLKSMCSTLLKCTCSFFFFFFPTHVLSSWALPRVLQDHSGCGVGGVCRDWIWCVSVGGVVSGAQDGPGCAAVRPRARLRRVRERQSGGVDDAVVPHQCYGNLYWLSHPPPTLTERWNVRYDTEHAFATPAIQTGFTAINISRTPRASQHLNISALSVVYDGESKRKGVLH